LRRPLKIASTVLYSKGRLSSVPASKNISESDVNVYQTVLPPALCRQDSTGSSLLAVANLVSCSSVKGKDEISIAAIQLSFGTCAKHSWGTIKRLNRNKRSRENDECHLLNRSYETPLLSERELREYRTHNMRSKL